ncbi:MAG TPA: hypothetical protein VFB84_20755 [Micromonosporaceae bacterium]|nr:hypothetical protein [Micromonosporaceae bacterium]
MGPVDVEVRVETDEPGPALADPDGSGAAPDAPSAPGRDGSGLATAGSGEPAPGRDPPDEPPDDFGFRVSTGAAPAGSAFPEAGADDVLVLGSVVGSSSGDDRSDPDRSGPDPPDRGRSSAGGESPVAPGLFEDSDAGTVARPTTDRPAASSSRGSVSTGVEVPAAPDTACVSVIN